MLKSLFPWKHHKTKAMAAQQTMDDGVPVENFERQELLPCHVCGRTFLPAPLRKHERICERTSAKKRKPFDSLKQRVEGTDLADFHQKSYLRKPDVASSAPDLKKRRQSAWKEKHLALVSAIRAAKGLPSDESSAPSKTKSTTALMAGTERCPSCDRQFGPKAYDRHVEWCKEKKAQQRIHHSPANVQLAKERLEARIKYVPPLNRAKKVLVREKYSNHASTETLVGVKSATPLSRGASVRKPRSTIDVGKNEKAVHSGCDERKERPRFEKSVSGGGDKKTTQESGERCVPVIASPSSKSEASKGSQRRRTVLPTTKLNNVDINSRTNGLTVTSLMYDTSKKMVTWKDTVRRTAPDKVGDKMGDERSSMSNNYVREGNAKSPKAPEVTCRATQSEKLRKRKDKLQCDKILSCNDVLHKNQPKKIPLSKYSFKSRLNATDRPVKHDVDVVSLDSTTTITAKSSSTDLEDLNVDVDKSSSCNSVANAFRKLKIDSGHDLKSEVSAVSPDTATENLESDSLLEISLADVKCEDDGARTACSDSDCPRNAHKEMSKWFDEYVKESEGGNCSDGTECEKSGEEIETGDKVESFVDNSAEEEEGEEEKEPNENLVLLFKSHTDLDLTKRSSEGHLKEDASEETFATNCDLDSVQLSCRRPSHFSLKKSSSDICLGLGGAPSNAGCSSGNTLVSIYRNKNGEAWDEESLTDNRKAVSSLPNIPINLTAYKNETGQEIKSAGLSKTKIFKQDERLRRKILEVAAKEFVQDCRGEGAEQKVQQGEGSNPEAPFLKFLEEEYTVPKKRRKVDSTYLRKKRQKVFRFSVLQNFDLAKFKALTVSGDGNSLEYRDGFQEKGTNGAVKAKDGDSCSEASSLSSVRSEDTLCGSSATAIDYSPRIFAILDNVLDGGRRRRPVDDKGLVVMTSSDCRRLIDLDREKLPELRRRLKEIKKQGRGRPGALRLPAIENRRGVSREDKEIQVDGTLSLPKIADKKLRRRDNAKKLEVDVRRDVGDVYLEYDGERAHLGYNPFESAQRQFMELLACDDFKDLTPTCTPAKHTRRPHTSDVTPVKQPSPTTAHKKTVRSAQPALAKVTRNANRASVIDPPSSFKDSLDSIADDFELMENLINDNFTDDNGNNNDDDDGGFYLHLKLEKESLTLGDILNGRKYSDDTSSIDPMLINENDNLSIPEHFRSDDYSPTSTADTDITIQNDIDHYSVRYDKKVEVFEQKPDNKKTNERSPPKTKTEKKPSVKRSVSLVNRAKTDDNPLKATNKKLTSKTKLTSKSVSSITSAKPVNGDKKRGLSTLKRSMTLFDPTPKPPPMKNRNDVDNYFSEQELKMSASVEKNDSAKELSDLLDETLKPEDLFNVDDEMYEEYKKYEEMYLKEKAQKSLTKKHKPKIVDVNLGVNTASEEDEHSPQFNNKICNDSAYGSLTRKTPKHRSRAATKLTTLEQKQPDGSSSSSGSENRPDSPAPLSHQRLSKFCHECGNKYPLTTAKFCVECGVKRLVL